jgi:ABC-type Zn uptake system ZnuABC Zn-binding protein ZnuA
VIQLVPDNTTPHTFELRPSDMRLAEKSAALFFGSENLDGWSSKIPVEVKISLLSLVPDKYLIKRNGAADPHFWLDPSAVKAMVPGLVEKLSEIDPGGKEAYRENGMRFADSLLRLANGLNNRFSGFGDRGFILTYPSPSYFMRALGLKVEDIIEPSPGKEPSPGRLMELIRLCVQKKVRAIIAIPELSLKPAKIISENGKLPIVTIFPLGTHSEQKDYFSLIKVNADLIGEEIHE